MLIHRTKKEYRESICARGLVPQYHKHKHYCPDLTGYVSASINFGYWGGVYKPERYDYWAISGVSYVPCRHVSHCEKSGKCDFAVVISGTVPSKKIQLLAEGA